MTALFGHDAPERVDIGLRESGGVPVEGGPRVPRRGEQAAADAVGGGREEPIDEPEGAGHRGAAGGFLFHGGGVFGGAGDVRPEGEDLVGETGVDGAGSERVEIDGLVAEFLGESFDEADDAGLGDTVSGKIDAGLGGAAAGESDDFGAARSPREQGMEGAERVESAVEISAHGGAPFDGVGGDGGTDLALDTGAADETVEVRPGGGDGGGGRVDLGPIGDIATRGEERAGVLRDEVGLVGAGEAPDPVPGGEQMGGEGAADAGAGTGENEVHAGDFFRDRNLASKARSSTLINKVAARPATTPTTREPGEGTGMLNQRPCR